MKRVGGNHSLPFGLPKGRKARAALYEQWAAEALRLLVGESTMWNVRIIQHAPYLEGKQWQVRVEGPDGAFVRDIDMASSQSEINEVVNSAHDEIKRSGGAFARL